MTQTHCTRIYTNLKTGRTSGSWNSIQTNARSCVCLAKWNHEYTPHGKVLEVVDSVKYLGVTITSDLRWNQQISNMETKGNQTLGFLRRNLRINSPDLKSINSLQEDSPAHCGIRLNCLGPTYQTL